MGPQNFPLLVQLLLPPLLEKCGEKMERLRRDWQRAAPRRAEGILEGGYLGELRILRKQR